MPASRRPDAPMDIKSGYPFWTVQSGLIDAFPPLESDVSCDVVVLGAGITGTLIAAELADAGLEVVVIDRRDAGWGSTSASTALLQYEIDTELVELAGMYGETAANAAYLACDEAIDVFAGRVDDLAIDVGFRRTGSLYFASTRGHVRRLRGEFDARRAAGLPVELLEQGEVRERFGLEAPLALWTPHAARVDPYRFTRHMLARLRQRGVGVFDRSTITGWTPGADGRLEIGTIDGPRLRSRHLVIAAGYETQAWLERKYASNRSSYALVTEPMSRLPLQLADNLLWESARPYAYLRATEDGRVLIGGEDDKIDLPLKRDAALPRKAAKLMAKLARLAPEHRFEIGFAWAGTFAETDDGLPYIGAPEGFDPRVHFAMAYGGNGITYSTIAAGILRDRVLGVPSPASPLFGFERRRS
jgi:glycine/D-amino acid oxidase-like deaminating enzyme